MTEVARQLNAVEGEAEGEGEKRKKARQRGGRRKRMKRKQKKGWPGGVILFVYWEKISR